MSGVEVDGLGLPPVVADAGSGAEPPAPRLQYAFEIQAECAPSVHIGRSEQEVVEFTPVTGGPVSGPLFQGSIIHSGGDWSTTRGQSCQVEARYLIRSEDGAVIDVLNRGYWLSSPDVDARLEAGESVAEEEYYFRCAPAFRTDHPDYQWMVQHQFLGVARDEGDGVIRILCWLVR